MLRGGATERKNGPRRAKSRRMRAACVVLGIAVSVASSVLADSPLEFAVKAAFIYKFISYVDWSPAAAASGPITLCVVGDDPVSAQLDQASEGQHVDARPIVVRHLPAVARDAPCQVIYIAEADPKVMASDLATLRGAPVLTITDADRMPGVAGIIAFTIHDNHVRFDVDDAAAAANGLTISSKLLGLAYSVKHRP
jgi:hypothetical protein